MKHQRNNQQLILDQMHRTLSHSLFVGIQTGVATMEICVENSQKAKINPLYDPAISLLGIRPKVLAFYFEGDCLAMFIDALFRIAREKIPTIPQPMNG